MKFFIWSRVKVIGEALFGMYYKQRAEDRMSAAFYDPRYVTQNLIDDVERSLEIIDQLLREGVKDERALPVQPRAGKGTAITEAPRLAA